MADQEHYVGVKAFVERDGKLLAVRASAAGPYASSLWGLPGGKINVDEAAAPFTATLSRELCEELGEGFKVSVGEAFYAWKFLRSGKLPILLVGIACTYQSGDIVLSSEFDAYAWVDPQDLSDYSLLPGHIEAIDRFCQLTLCSAKLPR